VLPLPEPTHGSSGFCLLKGREPLLEARMAAQLLRTSDRPATQEKDNPQSELPDVPLRDDLLFGAKAIADELGISERRAYYSLEHGHLPATKAGRIWVASLRRLRLHFSGEAS
jgi:hypothetical protein